MGESTKVMKPPTVFICYAHEDADTARDIARRLRRVGANPWLDKERLVLGEHWESAIKQAVADADAFVVCLRPGFNDIGFRQREVRWAREALECRPPGRGFIIPFIIHPCDLPNWCRDLHAGAQIAKPTDFMEIVRALAKHCGFVPESENALDIWRELTNPDLQTRRDTLLLVRDLAAGNATREMQTLHEILVRELIGTPALGLGVRERASAFDALGILGDPRMGVGVEDNLPVIRWVRIPGDEFALGSENTEDAEENELAADTRFVPRGPYDISMYPITVSQYACFVAAEGYESERLWTKGGWVWKQKNCITGPSVHGEPLSIPNRPQVGVSWYEAYAFCAWLSERLDQPVSLPTEPQWEKASRGTDRRVFPWGNALPTDHANYEATRIATASAVGCFVAGSSPYGCMDMAGNVWEWTRSVLRPYPYVENDGRETPEGDEPRVVRGGSFDNGQRLIRCAYRGRDFPSARRANVGFRVASGSFR